MAGLSISFTAAFDTTGKKLLLNETTGSYPAKDGGWGAPNPVLGDAVSASMSITGPEGTSTIDLMPYGWPTDNSSLQVEIDHSLIFGTDAVFPDGIYTLKYEIYGEELVLLATRTIRFLMDRGVCCCVDHYLAKIDPLCGCHAGELCSKMTPFIMLNVLRANAFMGNKTKVETLLTKLNVICQADPCKC